MRKLLSLLFYLGLAASATAQQVKNPLPNAGVYGAYNSSPPTCVAGTGCWIQTDINGNLKVAITSGGGGVVSGTVSNASDGVATSSTNIGSVSYNYVWDSGTPGWDRWYGNTNGGFVQGSVANGVADVGNPVKVGGVYNSPPPTLITGQRGDAQLDINGNLRAVNVLIAATAADGNANASQGLPRNGGSQSGGLFPPAFDYNYNGATWDRQFTCPNSAVVNVTAGATTQLVALSGSTNIRVCSIALTISAAGTGQFVSGTGTNCGTGTANLTGAMSFATATPLAISAGNASLFRSGASNALCLTAVTGNITGFISYAQY